MSHNASSVSSILKCNMYHLNPENISTLQVCSSYQIYHIVQCCYIWDHFEERHKSITVFMLQ